MEEEKQKSKMKGHFKIIALQIIFLIIVLGIIYFIYPKVNMNIHGNFVKLSSINADVIIISNSPEFTNPKYIDLREIKNVSFDLTPGKYYWRPYNNYLEGFSHEFEIKSEVGMKINNSENETDLVNIGNVKINVTKSENGVMVGHIILEPTQEEKIRNNGTYTGGQE